MTNKDFPSNLKYDKDYSWVKMEGDIAVIGVVGPAAKNVKEFVFIKLPKKGKNIKKGEEYVSLEALKWSGNLPSPLSGEIIDVNEELFDEPSVINNDAYGSWIMKIKLGDKNEVKELIDSEKADKFYKEKIK